MSTQEATFSYTLKVLSNLFSIRGEDADKMEQHLLEAKTLLPLIIEVTKLAQQVEQGGDPLGLVQKVFPNSTVIEDTPAPAGIPQQQTFAPVPPPTAPVATSSAPSCHHGTKTAKKGNGAKGEWRAWMCPAPKGTADQCSPAWVTKGTADWVNFPA